MDIFINIKHFFINFIQGTTNIFCIFLSFVFYLIGFPNKQSILLVVAVLFVLDIITKFYSIKIENNGLYKAFINKKITSKSFLRGFTTKVLGYFVILVIANFADITPELNIIGSIVSTILYVGLFFYEVISNLENLRDANFLGAIPILNKLKKEQDKFMESESLLDIKDQIIEAVKEQINDNKETVSHDSEAQG